MIIVASAVAVSLQSPSVFTGGAASVVACAFMSTGTLRTSLLLRSQTFCGRRCFWGCGRFAAVVALHSPPPLRPSALFASIIRKRAVKHASARRDFAAVNRSFFEKKRPTRGFQNFSMECSIFVHKKAKMPGYTRSIETKGGKDL